MITQQRICWRLLTVTITSLGFCAAAMPVFAQSSSKQEPATAGDPVHVANLPATTIRQLPELAKPDLRELLQSKEPADLGASPAKLPFDLPIEPAKKNWYQPTALLAALDELANTPATSAWAKEAKELIMQLGPSLAGDGQETARITHRLAELAAETPALCDRLAAAADNARLYAQKAEDWNTIRKLRKSGYALERRLEVWRAVARLGADRLHESECVLGRSGQVIALSGECRIEHSGHAGREAVARLFAA